MKLKEKETITDAGSRLEEFRLKLGLKKGEFSVRLGILPANYLNYLRGVLNIENLFFALQQMGADIEYIRTGVKSALTQILITTIAVYDMGSIRNQTVSESQPIQYIAVPKNNDQSLTGIRLPESNIILVISFNVSPTEGDQAFIVPYNDDKPCLHGRVSFLDTVVQLTPPDGRPVLLKASSIKQMYKIIYKVEDYST